MATTQTKPADDFEQATERAREFNDKAVDAGKKLSGTFVDTYEKYTLTLADAGQEGRRGDERRVAHRGRVRPGRRDPRADQGVRLGRARVPQVIGSPRSGRSPAGARAMIRFGRKRRNRP